MLPITAQKPRSPLCSCPTQISPQWTVYSHLIRVDGMIWKHVNGRAAGTDRNITVFMSVLSRVGNADDGVCEVDCSAGNERVSEGLRSSLKLSSTGSRFYSFLLMQTTRGRTTSYCRNIHTLSI